MCRWLDVSPSGFYAFVEREESARAKADKQLLKMISRIHWDSGGRYGSPRVYKRLKSLGIKIGEKRVERLMKEAGLQGRVVQVTRRTKGMKEHFAQGTNLILTLEAPTGPNQVWVSDVTYLRVKGKWHYLATVMDLYSRRIIGWSLSDTRTTSLTRAALTYAYRKRGKPDGVVIHSDRGVEYLGAKYQELLMRYGMKQSLNRAGHCTDNACMESFYHSLKGELIRGTTFRSVQHLRKSLANYINSFYNSVRLHSGIEYVSPIEYELRNA